MSYLALNAFVLPVTITRQRKHSKKAIEGLSPLFELLSAKRNLQEQMEHLKNSLDKPEDPNCAGAIQAWADLIRGHALDFHADAGADGQMWQHAAIDAWQMWLLIRRGSAIDASWPWVLEVEGMKASGQYYDLTGLEHINSPVEYDDPNLQIQFKELSLNEWEKVLLERSNTLAVEESYKLYQEWPNIDLPSLAIAMGALWALAITGKVSGFTSLDLSGVGEQEMITTAWSM